MGGILAAHLHFDQVALDDPVGQTFGQQLGPGAASGPHFDDASPEPHLDAIRPFEPKLRQAEEHLIADSVVAHHAQHVPGDSYAGRGRGREPVENRPRRRAAGRVQPVVAA